MQVWNAAYGLLKYRTQKIAKTLPSWHNRTTSSGCIFATKACIDNWKKLFKQQYLLQMSPQYRRLMAEMSWWVGGTQQIWTGFASWLRYCSDIAHRSPTKLCTIFGHLLGWYTIYGYIFGCCCSLTEFCLVENSLCIQVLHSPILAALLHGTRAAGSPKLCGVVQGMELWNFRRGRHLYSAGRPSCWAAAHILVFKGYCEELAECGVTEKNKALKAGQRQKTDCVCVYSVSFVNISYTNVCLLYEYIYKTCPIWAVVMAYGTVACHLCSDQLDILQVLTNLTAVRRFATITMFLSAKDKEG